MSLLHLRLLVFTCGAAVMAVEMTAIRLFAPFFGTSLLVTTVVIGAMMAALAVGYWIGGRAADRHPTMKRLSAWVAVAAVGVFVVPLLGRPVLNAASAMMRPLITGEGVSDPQVTVAMVLGSLIGVVGLLALPVALLGAVSPWAIRLAVSSVDESGRAAGQLYALSTAGSILGTFLPALVLLPALGVRKTFFAAGIVLLAIALPGLLGWVRGGAIAGVSLLTLLVPDGVVRPMEGLVHEEESLYHFLQVVREPFGACPDANHLYLNEGIAVHSVRCNVDNREAAGGCWTALAGTPLWREEPMSTQDVLIVGLAGGTVARQLLDAFPEARIDGVEIDGAVVDAGVKWFDNGHPNVNPIVMDGRVWLQATDKRYDVIIVDAYRQPYIPFHLTTTEFWAEVTEHLTDDGVVGLNVANVRGESRDLLRMLVRTLREHFASAHVFRAGPSNDVVYASVRPRSRVWGPSRLFRHPDPGVLTELLDDWQYLPLDDWKDARVLSDDHAPVEQTWDLQVLGYVL